MTIQQLGKNCQGLFYNFIFEHTRRLLIEHVYNLFCFDIVMLIYRIYTYIEYIKKNENT